MTCRVVGNAMIIVAGSEILVRAEIPARGSRVAALGGVVGSLVAPRRTRDVAISPAGHTTSAVVKAPRRRNAYQ